MQPTLEWVAYVWSTSFLDCFIGPFERAGVAEIGYPTDNFDMFPRVRYASVTRRRSKVFMRNVLYKHLSCISKFSNRWSLWVLVLVAYPPCEARNARHAKHKNFDGVLELQQASTSVLHFGTSENQKMKKNKNQISSCQSISSITSNSVCMGTCTFCLIFACVDVA